MTDLGLLAELNRDVWGPFQAAYRAYDTEGYLRLHTENLIRAGGPQRSVQSYAEVAAETGPWFAGAAERGMALAIEFRFVERLAAGGLASERGIYRITAGDDVFLGRFHTFSRLVGDRWRIAVDYDSNEPAVDEAAFAAGTTPDDLSPYA